MFVAPEVVVVVVPEPEPDEDDRCVGSLLERLSLFPEVRAALCIYSIYRVA